ncbi:uncharacterized protein [Pyxicephalus adspersus]|uniref:uncharacterized protein n=1 Tax=Pyxicephalus adspersus TaxID=30357 RepID=UPI003B5940E7
MSRPANKDTPVDIKENINVEERCSGVEVRLAATRKCVSPEQYDCTPFCGPMGGELSPELGMCHCAQYVSAEELCDHFCLMKAPKISMSFGSNRQFLLQIDESEKRRSRKLEVLNVLGPDHIWSSERVRLVVFASNGIFGVIVSSAQTIEAFLTERASSHYPIYQKDHLFNSNPHWDFGAFRRLDYLIRETNVNISSLQFYETVGCRGSGEVFDIGRKEITYGLDERNTIRVLEDFSVRTLFDKLEDQTLHLTSQLGRHRNETLSFYKAFIQRIQLLKDMIQNLELSSNKGFGWRKVPLDGEVESLRTNITSQQSVGSATSMTGEIRTNQGEFLQEATELMKALKLTLMKASAGFAVKKEGAEIKQQHGGVIGGINEHNVNKLQDRKPTMKNPYEAIVNGNTAMLSMEGLHLQPLQIMTALYREDNLRRLISASPLTKTLEELKEALKAQAKEKEMKETVTLKTTGDLVPINISQLSPYQLVVYQFGSAILHFAWLSCSTNPPLLLAAQSIPKVRSSVQGREALRLDASYYDSENRVLYVPRTCMEHAGELAVCIIHAVAQIKAGQQQLPVDCDYLHWLNRAVIEICRAFFHYWSTGNMTLVDENVRHPEISPMVRDLLFLHKRPDYSHIPKRRELHNRLNTWKEISSTFRKKADCEKKQHTKDDLKRTILQEEVVDGLNEEFLQLVTQSLQNKNERKELTLLMECDKDPSMLARISEKTRMGAMLEIKRRYTEEKIRTAESDLLYLQPTNITSSPLPGSGEDYKPA